MPPLHFHGPPTSGGPSTSGLSALTSTLKSSKTRLPSGSGGTSRTSLISGLGSKVNRCLRVAGTASGLSTVRPTKRAAVRPLGILRISEAFTRGGEGSSARNKKAVQARKVLFVVPREQRGPRLVEDLDPLESQ